MLALVVLEKTGRIRGFENQAGAAASSTVLVHASYRPGVDHAGHILPGCRVRSR
jgi:hypothetical protein